jgi:hypothetical protein
VRGPCKCEQRGLSRKKKENKKETQKQKHCRNGRKGGKRMPVASLQIQMAEKGRNKTKTKQKEAARKKLTEKRIGHETSPA